MRRVFRLVRCFVRWVDQRQTAFFQANTRGPVLVHYQSDATSYLCAFRKSLGGQVIRGGHDLCEFLSERIFVATTRGQQVWKSAVFVWPPRLLLAGKRAGNHLTALRESLPLPFSSGLHDFKNVLKRKLSMLFL